jgi:hypothetical protein
MEAGSPEAIVANFGGKANAKGNYFRAIFQLLLDLLKKQILTPENILH